MIPSDTCRTVMIVEDDGDVREVLTHFLRAEGYSVVTAANGKEAINQLRQTPDACMILLDLMMPVMNGWQFRDKQQEDPELASIPVVVISAVGNLREKAGELEAAGYIEKPVDLDRLLDTVERHCRAS